MPDGSPQRADVGVVEAGELPAHRRPTPDRSRMPDGGPQSADDRVLAAAHVDGRRAAEARNAVAGVEVEPNVADLESGQLRNPQAADGGQCNHEPIALVPEVNWAHAEQRSNDEPVDGEEQRRGTPHQ
jgi:hypothetical protein